jgi:hypothetical protein
MGTPFENFINREIPRRPVLLTVELTGYNGDPNEVGVPVIVSDAPKGTFYLRDAPKALYQKGSSAPGTYYQVNGGGGGGEAGSRRYNILLAGDKDGFNQVFTTPEPFVPGWEAVFWNGFRLVRGASADYTTSEGAGPGTGYDTVTLTWPPQPGEALEADYSIAAIGSRRYGIPLLGDIDGSNQTFTTPDYFTLGSESVFWNGVKRKRGVDDDYIAEESGGPGTGYDTIVVAVAPIIGETLVADYSVGT